MQRRRVRARRIMKRHIAQVYSPQGRHRQRDRISRRADRGFDLKKFEQPLGGTGGTLQVAHHFADRARRTGHEDRVKHERRQLTRGNAAGDDIVAANPENDADRTEHQQDHDRDQHRTLPYPLQRCPERTFDSCTEFAPVLCLVTVGLHGANFMQCFVDVGADLADTILRAPRELAHPTTEENDRHQHQRHPDQHQEGELRAGQRQHHEPPDHQQDVANGHRCARSDHRLEHRRIVGQARDYLARAHHFKIARWQRQQMIEHCAPQVGGNALADP